MLEILAPSGNEECAEVAIVNGADAIYLGYTAFSARDGADNFDDEALCRILQKAHFVGVKVYVAMNTLVKESELDGFFSTLLKLWNLGVDAIILQDLLLGKYIHSLYPQIVLHVSTQAGVCTEAGAKLAKEYGFSRVILARETPLAEIAKIAKVLETEVFVQGALCTCFSGQCYFSSFVGGNSGNRGRCKQPCRKKYTYNRNGFEEKAYALSLSDLSVGEDIQKLIEAGVVSFKIEGRMRRKEYVGAAVRYYRSLLSGTASNSELSDLKRTYNRGNYTKGLAFGQDKRFLSRAVQGHIGEKVGVVKVEKGRFLVESAFRAKQGDAFKILREGKEVGGAAFGGVYSRRFVLFSKTRLLNGDTVFVTTDSEVNARVVQGQEKKKPLQVSLRFAVGERAYAQANGLSVYSDSVLEEAANRALSVEEIQDNFSKVDGLPLQIEFTAVDVVGNVFMPKSLLNAFRRSFYAAVSAEIVSGNREQLEPLWKTSSLQGTNQKLAVISDDFTGVECDIAICKLNDFQAGLPDSFLALSAEKYVYMPPFHTSADIRILQKLLQENGLDGIYADSYEGLLFAKQCGCKLFAGTGFNLTNSQSIAQIYDEVEYYAISKELSERELEGLISSKSFVLSSGDIKIMDLCYCPFGKTCARCDKKERYHLTDENSRVFPVRRYVDGDGNCRFEIYNCASLVGGGAIGAGKLIETTMQEEKKSAVLAVNSEVAQKKVYAAYTSGHMKNGVL